MRDPPAGDLAARGHRRVDPPPPGEPGREPPQYSI